MAGFNFPSRFRTKRFDYPEVETLLGAADQLDEFYKELEDRPDSDLANSMGDDLRRLVADDMPERS
jgi:hypothetical protein